MFKYLFQFYFICSNKTDIFQSENIWNLLTAQGHQSGRLAQELTVNDIVSSWITKDRLPAVFVDRNYADKTATVTQRVYLRERPHDVPEQDKMLWFIPLILVTQNNLNFTNFTPSFWMKKTREVVLKDLPNENEFIIVNPEEIGPFPVNYDTRNWNLLANYL